MNTDSQDFQQPEPFFIRRDLLAKAAPHIERIRDDLLASIKAQGCDAPLSPGVTVSTEYVRPLITHQLRGTCVNKEIVSAQTLILFLPPEFEEVLEDLVNTGPEVLNHPDSDLRDNRTYFSWACTLGGEDARTNVWVANGALPYAMFDSVNFQTESWGWVPVIAMAGNSVAVGGFAVDLDFVSGLQAACMSAQSTMPEEIYSADELTAAKEEASFVGLKPWLYRRRMSGYGNLTLLASVYVCVVGE